VRKGGSKSLSWTMLSVEKERKECKTLVFFIQKQNQRLVSTVMSCKNQCILVVAEE
jgi:hypothetical protein